MTQVGLLTETQKDSLIGQLYDEDSYFNPIQYDFDNLIISVEEMEANPVLEDILTNDHNFSYHLNLSKMIEKKGAHDADLNNKIEQDFKEHVMKSTIAKVKFIKKVEAILKVDSFDIGYDTHHTKYNNDVNLEEAVLKLYKKVFADSNKKN